MNRLMLAFVVLVAARLAAAADYAVSGHGTLTLQVPQGWIAQQRSMQDAIAMRFRPPAGDSFEVQVTGIWVQPARLASLTPDSLKTFVQQAADKALASAVEKEAKVVPLGGTAPGYQYSITDRGQATGPGDYKYMTQGNVLVGELLTVFTVFYRDAGNPVKDEALRMLAGASYTKTSAASAPRQDALRVEETAHGYELSVPVSRLVMMIPKGGLSPAGRPSGGSTDNPRYFYFADPAARLFVSGWFEPQERFSGVQKAWAKDVAEWRQRGLPEPRNVVFTKVDGWEVIVYDLAVPNGATNSHVRAHWVQAGTWVDMHVSVIGRETSEKYRADLLAFLRSVEVRERK